MNAPGSNPRRNAETIIGLVRSRLVADRTTAPSPGQRVTLLVASLALVTFGLALAWFQPGTAETSAWTAVSLRSGLFLGALWLALPEVLAIRPWRVVGLALLAVLVSWRPQVFLILVAGLVAVAFLRPRWRG